MKSIVAIFSTTLPTLALLDIIFISSATNNLLDRFCNVIVLISEYTAAIEAVAPLVPPITGSPTL